MAVTRQTTPDPVPWQQVLAPPARAAMFLVLTVPPGREAAVVEAFADVAGLVRAVGVRTPETELSCVVGVGADFWSRAYDVPAPQELHPLPEFHGEQHSSVSTPGDVLVHLRAHQLDTCFELATRLMDRLRGLADVVDEVHGFKFFDERDLLGFVDGTENPRGDDAAVAALVGQEDARHAGGSYVVVQKYLHDLDAWEALTVEQQEAAIGRHKLSDVEIPDDDKAPDAHAALTSITDPDGTDRKIVRANMPFGRVGAREFGTYFIGYSASPAVTEQMLRHMFVGGPSGHHDRILDFSTPVTGGLFFVPTAAFLDDPDTAADERRSS